MALALHPSDVTLVQFLGLIMVFQEPPGLTTEHRARKSPWALECGPITLPGPLPQLPNSYWVPTTWFLHYCSIRSILQKSALCRRVAYDGKQDQFGLYLHRPKRQALFSPLPHVKKAHALLLIKFHLSSQAQLKPSSSHLGCGARSTHPHPLPRDTPDNAPQRLAQEETQHKERKAHTNSSYVLSTL